jgi:hypothetical protein
MRDAGSLDELADGRERGWRFCGCILNTKPIDVDELNVVYERKSS